MLMMMEWMGSDWNRPLSSFVYVAQNYYSVHLHTQRNHPQIAIQKQSIPSAQSIILLSLATIHSTQFTRSGWVGDTDDDDGRWLPPLLARLFEGRPPTPIDRNPQPHMVLLSSPTTTADLLCLFSLSLSRI